MSYHNTRDMIRTRLTFKHDWQECEKNAYFHAFIQRYNSDNQIIDFT